MFVRPSEATEDEGRTTVSEGVALTPQPSLPSWERGSRGSDGGEGIQRDDVVALPEVRVAAEAKPIETKPIFVQPSVVEPPAAEAAAADTQQPIPNTQYPMPNAQHATPNTQPLTPGKPRNAFETRPLFAQPSAAEADEGQRTQDEGREIANEQPATDNRQAQAAPAVVIAELLMQPAGAADVAAQPKSAAGTRKNKTPQRGSALQRAVERLKGQMTTASAGVDRLSLL
jgi:hypothetical protein